MELHAWWVRVLDAIAPRRCAACDEVPGPLCPACLETVADLRGPPARREPYGRSRAALPHETPVRELLHAGKYGGDRRALDVLGTLALERLLPALCGLPVPEAVIPVPLAVRRRRTRGFNQSQRLASALAAAVPGSPPVDTRLVRIRETRAQVGRRADQRRLALDGAFAWTGDRLGGGTVWLVDDVITTGTTVAAAAATLQQAGAGRIEAVAATAASMGCARESSP